MGGPGFEAIRPYEDDEVAAVIARLTRDPTLLGAVGRFQSPRLHRLAPRLIRWAVGHELRRRVRTIDSVQDFQNMLSRYFERVLETTTSGFTFSGSERLDPARAYLFVSNHRDIAMDSAFMNYALYRSGMATSRIAIGDNLFTEASATDLMRLNKGFVVRRKVKGVKAQFAALSETSTYIRQSVEAGHSVWIAQREGRAKDGYDRTDPAIIKMFGIAYRREAASLAEAVRRLGIVPVAVSYELDPTDDTKARELHARAMTGAYDKPPGEDLRSLVAGITGRKGRVHVAFAGPLTEAPDDAEAIAEAIDRAIVGSMRVFPTHEQAFAALEHGAAVAAPALAARLACCPPPHREYLLLEYANVLRNARDLGVTVQPDAAESSAAPQTASGGSSMAASCSRSDRTCSDQ